MATEAASQTSGMEYHHSTEPVILYEGVTKHFTRGKREIFTALEGISFRVEKGSVTGMVGPDGAGKTTLIRLACGLLFADEGSVRVRGWNVSDHPQQVQSRVGYMPQKFGLYEDLTVQENLDLYGDLHGITGEQLAERTPALMQMTGLGRFMDRLAGRLSGGMKQKLGLACTLLSSPDVLLLDEPTVGVDPLSRRDLWEIIHQLVADQGLSVLVSTSYLDEAERCHRVAVLHHGRLLGEGPPSRVSEAAAGGSWLAEPPASLKLRQLQSRLITSPGIVDATLEGKRVRFVASDHTPWESGILENATCHETSPRFEDGFMVLLRRAAGTGASIPAADGEKTPTVVESSPEVVVEVRDLVRQFGTFYAVKNVNFQVRRGEIFGLLGPNGAGKSTTFRMLCGLLPASSGTLRVAGVDLRHARASARQRMGYVAQKFSLYGQQTVMENLEFFAGAYGLRRERKNRRIQWALDQFELQKHVNLPSGELPGGYKQRLAMACALMHEPEILFLDEPTSGVDPIARREFWYRINGLADGGVTVIVTTHFMEEAEYCDRMVIMLDGEILAEGAPSEIRQLGHGPEGREPTIEDAFIAIVEDFQAAKAREAA
ncbi:ATP-binding cassette domain-containing protein [Desulforhabdus sp. TSK]|uniref:ATP-binding cassette domain-containing protein n=1 Tax=Desulforhabdus sp. TSK TaxID=2925014 RepID=UPI001FC84878|nr:ATP-binding cassette domain-containing protein [Desulforhabdus sp. TSK]GKT09924.1 ABC transporter ATP-binding protein [Desulforhabdus sp. TSK]